MTRNINTAGPDLTCHSNDLNTMMALTLSEDRADAAVEVANSFREEARLLRDELDELRHQLERMNAASPAAGLEWSTINLLGSGHAGGGHGIAGIAGIAGSAGGASGADGAGIGGHSLGSSVSAGSGDAAVSQSIPLNLSAELQLLELSQASGAGGGDDGGSKGPSASPIVGNAAAASAKGGVGEIRLVKNGATSPTMLGGTPLASPTVAAGAAAATHPLRETMIWSPSVPLPMLPQETNISKNLPSASHFVERLPFAGSSSGSSSSSSTVFKAEVDGKEENNNWEVLEATENQVRNLQIQLALVDAACTTGTPSPLPMNQLFKPAMTREQRVAVLCDQIALVELKKSIVEMKRKSLLSAVSGTDGGDVGDSSHGGSGINSGSMGASGDVGRGVFTVGRSTGTGAPRLSIFYAERLANAEAAERGLKLKLMLLTATVQVAPSIRSFPANDDIDWDGDDGDGGGNIDSATVGTAGSIASTDDGDAGSANTDADAADSGAARRSSNFRTSRANVIAGAGAGSGQPIEEQHNTSVNDLFDELSALNTEVGILELKMALEVATCSLELEASPIGGSGIGSTLTTSVQTRAVELQQPFSRRQRAAAAAAVAVSGRNNPGDACLFGPAAAKRAASDLAKARAETQTYRNTAETAAAELIAARSDIASLAAAAEQRLHDLTIARTEAATLAATAEEQREESDALVVELAHAHAWIQRSADAPSTASPQKATLTGVQLQQRNQNQNQQQQLDCRKEKPPASTSASTSASAYASADADTDAKAAEPSLGALATAYKSKPKTESEPKRTRGMFDALSARLYGSSSKKSSTASVDDSDAAAVSGIAAGSGTADAVDDADAVTGTGGGIKFEYERTLSDASAISLPESINELKDESGSEDEDGGEDEECDDDATTGNSHLRSRDNGGPVAQPSSQPPGGVRDGDGGGSSSAETENCGASMLLKPVATATSTATAFASAEEGMTLEEQVRMFDEQVRLKTEYDKMKDELIIVKTQSAVREWQLESEQRYARERSRIVFGLLERRDLSTEDRQAALAILRETDAYATTLDERMMGAGGGGGDRNRSSFVEEPDAPVLGVGASSRGASAGAKLRKGIGASNAVAAAAADVVPTEYVSFTSIMSNDMVTRVSPLEQTEAAEKASDGREI